MAGTVEDERLPTGTGRRTWRRSLARDVVAGGSVAMVGIPQSLAYAELAGMNPIVGLYAGAIPPILAAVFASSPYLQTGPVAITALLTFGALSGMLIAGSQTSKALGVPPPPFDSEIVDGVWSLLHPGSWNPAAVAISGATAVIVLGGRRLHRLFPGVVVAAVLGIAVSMLGLIGFTEAASISRRFASEDRTRWSADREFVSQGAANLAAAAFGGMPCGGSFSRSSVNRMSGAATRLSGGITGLVVLAFLPFATVLEPLPLAVLGTIVIVAVIGLMRFGPLVRLWRVSVPQAVIAWGTFVATVLLAPRLDLAVLVGVGLSIAVFLWRSLQLDVDVVADGTTLTFTPRGVLWFGTAQRLDTALLDALAEHPGANRLVVDLARLGRIDTTGALVLRSVLDQARQAGLTADVEGIPPQSRQLTERVLRSVKDPLG